MERGRAITGFDRAVRKRDLARVRARYLPGIPDAAATKGAFSRATGFEFGGSAAATFHPPATRTEYFSSAEDLWWDFRLDERDSEGLAGTVALDLHRSYQAGRSYSETWNEAVFSPSLPAIEEGWANRVGDLILTNLPTFGDGSGHAGWSTGDRTVALYRDGELGRVS